MKDKILELIQIKGPLLPADIRSELRIDSIFIGAYLSELSKDGKIKASNTKIGNSPVYYLKGQEGKLTILEKYLHPAQQKVLARLKEKKVLRDSELDDVTKAALRDLKDFAAPLKVNKEQIFWKYCPIDQNEAIGLIKTIISPPLQPVPA